MGTDSREYWVIVQAVPKESGGGFFAKIPALPGCFTQGSTLDEVEENIRDLVPLWLEQLEADGEAIPPSDVNSPVPRIQPIVALRPRRAQQDPCAHDRQFLTAVSV